MAEIGADWRVVDGVATAWFDSRSLIEGAALAGRRPRRQRDGDHHDSRPITDRTEVGHPMNSG
jgi:hypothetical protein